MPPLLAVCFAKTVNPCAWAKSDFIVFTSFTLSPDKDKLTLYEACVYQHFTVSPQERNNMCLVECSWYLSRSGPICFLFQCRIVLKSVSHSGTNTDFSQLSGFSGPTSKLVDSKRSKGSWVLMCWGAQPDQPYSWPVLEKEWGILQLLPAMLHLDSYQKKNKNKCSCHVFDLDLAEMCTGACSFCSSWRQSEWWGLRSLREKGHMLKPVFIMRTVMKVAQRGWAKDLLRSLPAQLSCNTTIPCYITVCFKSRSNPERLKITVVIIDLRQDFISVCFKEWGDDVFVCSPLEQEELGDLLLDWGWALHGEEWIWVTCLVHRLGLASLTWLSYS